MQSDDYSGQSTVVIVRRLEILGRDKVTVPGCEPTSEVTSTTLMNQQRAVCKNAVVDLQDALDAIPGSTVEEGTNFGPVRQRWFILPAVGIECCYSPVDYYKILRDLDSVAPVIEDKFDFCNTIGMGHCPSPDFKYASRPSQSTYFKEGTDVLHDRHTP